jgi:hypothetical protein
LPSLSTISRATSSAFAATTSATTTAAPSPANRKAMTRPIPDPPPVTITVRPEKRGPLTSTPASAQGDLSGGSHCEETATNVPQLSPRLGVCRRRYDGCKTRDRRFEPWLAATCLAAAAATKL